MNSPNQETMKAAVVDRYGPPEVAKIERVPKPVAADDELLIRVHATTVNSGDARMRAGKFPRGLNAFVKATQGLRGPKQRILGFSAAGEVEAVGRAVTRFEPGDRVVASHGFKFGCHAEYMVAPETGLVAKIPDSLSYQDAASILFGGATALYFFRLGKLKRGESILINGASGAVGTIAVELAKQAGAIVTGVCGSSNVALVKSLGADHVIDYTKQDFSSGDERYDLVMDTQGNVPYAKAKRLLKPGGRFLMVVGDLFQMAAGFPRKDTVLGTENDDQAHLASWQQLLDLARQGAIKPVTGRVLPFEQIEEAYRLVDSGHKVGSVALTFD
jgi:NADPH:quinone reductase-like Zn-dependent oxidoreductase